MSLSRLLEDEPISFYWIGFLLADGCIKGNKRLTLTLSIKAEDHLLQFCNYIDTHIRYSTSNGFGGNFKVVSTSKQDPILVPKIMNKFGFITNKTYNPPEWKNYTFTDDLLFSLFLGFFDGDGNIQKRIDKGYFGRIKNHHSWTNNIVVMRNFLVDHLNVLTKQYPKLNSQGYIFWSLTADMLNKMKTKAKILSLPILETKWKIVGEQL